MIQLSLTRDRGRLGRSLAALAFIVLLSSCRRGGVAPSADQVDPPPRELPYLRIPLPPSVQNYHAYEKGLQSSLLQLRFDLPPKDAKALALRLPCRFGPEQAGPPEYALVGTNDRSWYRVGEVKKYRGCSYQHGIRSAEFLLDLDDPKRVVVYAIIASE